MKEYTHIIDRFCYRFSERVTQGLIKVPRLQIIRLTIHGGIAAPDDDISFCTIEMSLFIPVFQKFYELRNESQETRIKQMQEFLKQPLKTIKLN